MSSKFGKNGTDVERFFDEVSNTRNLAQWTTVLSGYDSKSRIAARDAIRDVGLSASVDSSIGKAARSAIGAAGVRRQDMPEPEYPPMAFSRILGMVGLAAVAIALGSKLPAEHRRALLAPFAGAGFASVLVAMPDQDEPSGGPDAPEAGSS